MINGIRSMCEQCAARIDDKNKRDAEILLWVVAIVLVIVVVFIEEPERSGTR
jgi:type II secretory pathway component PulM